MDVFEDGKKVEPEVIKEVEYKSPVADTSKETTAVAHELSIRPFRELFNLGDTYSDSKLEEIIQWAKPNGKVSQEEAIEKINNIASKLGSPDLGDSKLDMVYRRVKILQTLSNLAEGEF